MEDENYMQDDFKVFLNKINDKTTDEQLVIEEWTNALQELADQIGVWLSPYEKDGLLTIKQEITGYKSPILKEVIKYASVTLIVNGIYIYFKPQTGGFFKNVIREVFVQVTINQMVRQQELAYDNQKTWKLKLPDDPFNKKAPVLSEDVLKKLIQTLIL
jgi:hypothetical protein